MLTKSEREELRQEAYSRRKLLITYIYARVLQAHN